MNRSQVSLIIGDDKLYKEFVKPLSSEKRLMPLIVKLLGSYYYNSEVQELVDGVSVDSLKEKQEFVSDDNLELREKLEDIRATSQLFGMLMQDAHTSLEEGMDAVSKFAEMTGDSTNTSYSDRQSTPRISMKCIDELHSRESCQSTKKDVDGDIRYSELRSDVDEMKGNIDKILRLLEGASFSVTSISESNVVSTEVCKDNLYEYDSFDDISESVLSEERTDTSESTYINEVEEVSISNEEEEHTQNQEEGLSLLKSLVSSGGIGGFMT